MQQKHRVQFAPNGSYVSYINNVTYYYNPAVSCAGCSEDDKITIPNLVLHVRCQSQRCTKPIESCIVRLQQIAQMFEDQGPLIKWALGAAMTALGESLYTTHSVREITFEGYKDNFIGLLNNPAIRKIIQKANITLPERIGLFYGVRCLPCSPSAPSPSTSCCLQANGTDDGQYVIHTGKDDVNMVRY